MPIVFVHGVTVRQPGVHVLAEKVQSKIIEHGLAMPFDSYFWGGSGVSLRWGGDSIPGITPEERRNQLEVYSDAVPLPDLRQFLLASPLLELNAWRETRTFAAFDREKAALDQRRGQLEAAKRPLAESLTQHFKAYASLRLPDDLSLVFDRVGTCLDAAAQTRANLTVPDLLDALARSLTASLYVEFVPADDLDGTEVVWESIYDPVRMAVESTLGGQAGLFGDLLRHSALSLALPLLRGMRGRLMPPVVRFLGDVFVYLSDRDAFLEGMHAVVTRALNESDSPLWIVAHSLGGVISFDYCSRYPTAVERLVTVGSQTGLFAEGDLLFARHPDHAGDRHDERPLTRLDSSGKRMVPENVARWVNIYDFNDLLSFRCAPIFDRVEDYPITGNAPFPESHGAYWDRDETYRLMLG